jgi:hypothetical protein
MCPEHSKSYRRLLSAGQHATRIIGVARRARVGGMAIVASIGDASTLRRAAFTVGRNLRVELE